MKYYQLFARNAHLKNAKGCSNLIKDMARIEKVSYIDMLRKVGQKAANENDYPTFKMVVTLKGRLSNAVKK